MTRGHWLHALVGVVLAALLAVVLQGSPAQVVLLVLAVGIAHEQAQGDETLETHIVDVAWFVIGAVPVILGLLVRRGFRWM